MYLAEQVQYLNFIIYNKSSLKFSMDSKNSDLDLFYVFMQTCKYANMHFPKPATTEELKRVL